MMLYQHQNHQIYHPNSFYNEFGHQDQFYFYLSFSTMCLWSPSDQYQEMNNDDHLSSRSRKTNWNKCLWLLGKIRRIH